MEWLPIILKFLDPILAKCFPSVSSGDPKEYLAARYDAATGKMDPALVRRAMTSTRKAIKKAHRDASREDRKTFPRYSRDQIYQITEQRLIDAMNAPLEQVSAAFAAAADLPDEE